MTELLQSAIDATTSPVAQQASDPAHPTWVSAPETSDATLTEATGRGWDAWVAIIDAGPARGKGHTEIADWVKAETDIVSWWWAQNVTVGYERITGLRLPGQMKDGTFTVSRTRALDMTVDQARAIFEEPGRLAASVPGLTLTRASKPGVKTPRFKAADASGTSLGDVTFTADPVKSGARIAVTHEKLPSPGAADAWKAYWSDWVARL